MQSSSDKSVYSILLSANAVSQNVLDRVFKDAQQLKIPLSQKLVRDGIIQEPKMLEIFSKSTGAPCIPLKNTPVDKALVDRVPIKLAGYYKFFPYKSEDGKIKIAVSQIFDIHVLDEIRFGLGAEIETAFAPEKEIEEMLQKHYGVGAETVNKILTQSSEGKEGDEPAETHQVEDIEALADTASVSQLVNQIILDAYRKRASDIHLEPFRGPVRIRYRIDGVLHDMPVPPEIRKFFMPMIARIKILANMNVIEKRLPQDGKMRVKTHEEALDLRISSIPTTHGESLVIRILPGKNYWSLDQLGFTAANLQILKGLLERPNGILFVTGPTGSGKSTTLYAALNALNNNERKIITIEDPVEFELEKVSQIQVAPEIGLSFAAGLRSVLRHDPDILMVGEVRDFETADIAIRAALTGHLILSTLHTNDAASGIARLKDIGIEPYLIASSVIAFIAQRLVRVICPYCKEEDPGILLKTRQMILNELHMDPGEPVHIQRAKGCESCNQTGFGGRITIHEILVIDEEMRKLIMSGAPAETLKTRARQAGLVTLRQDGWKKVLGGITTPEEILKVVPTDAALQTFENVRQKGVGPIYFQQPSASSEAAEPPKTEEDPFAGKRKHKRVNKPVPISYRVADYQGRKPEILKMKTQLSNMQWEAVTKDLSAGGLMFSSKNHCVAGRRAEDTEEIWLEDVFEVNNILELKINLPDGGSPIECMAKVRRLARSTEPEEVEKETRVFEAGVMFLVINSPDRIRLEKFCQ